MRKLGTRNRTTPARRSQILEAALQAFTRLGYEAATVDDVCAEAGVSKGSLYHHFTGKSDLAMAIYLDATAELHDRMRRALQRGKTPEAAVRGFVRAYLTWFEERPQQGAFVYQSLFVDGPVGRAKELRESDRAFFEEVLAWVAPLSAAGRVERLPRGLYVALVIGPSRDFLRRWLLSPSAAEMRVAKATLSRRAWDVIAPRR